MELVALSATSQERKQHALLYDWQVPCQPGLQLPTKCSCNDLQKVFAILCKKDKIHRFVVKGNQYEVNFIQLENTLFS